MNPSNELNKLICDELETFSSDLPVSAEVLADIVIKKIDPSEDAPILVRFGCVMELRQMSRSLLRREYKSDTESQQGELFEGLQDRYPGAGNRSGTYLPRSMMSISDYEMNIKRLRKEGAAKIAHADALNAEMIERINNNEIAS